MSDRESRISFWYDELAGEDFPLVGKKNANLGEIRSLSGPAVPGGFALTAAAYVRFMEANGLFRKIGDIVSKVAPVEEQANPRLPQ